MSYYALVNTAHPATGLITIGEYLTEKQAAALGEEKIAELVKAGVLGVDLSGASRQLPQRGSQEADGTAADAPPAPSPEEGAKEVQEGDRKALLQEDTSDAAPKKPTRKASSRAKKPAKTEEPTQEEALEEEDLPTLDAADDLIREAQDAPKKSGRRTAR